MWCIPGTGMYDWLYFPTFSLFVRLVVRKLKHRITRTRPRCMVISAGWGACRGNPPHAAPDSVTFGGLCRLWKLTEQDRVPNFQYSERRVRFFQLVSDTRYRNSSRPLVPGGKKKQKNPRASQVEYRSEKPFATGKPQNQILCTR